MEKLIATKFEIKLPIAKRFFEQCLRILLVNFRVSLCAYIIRSKIFKIGKAIIEYVSRVVELLRE